MNAELGIEAGLKHAHREATSDFNRWRGRCTDCYARIDHAAMKALLAFASTSEGDGSIRNPPFFGQRVEAIRKAIGPDGRFHTLGNDAWKVLGKLEPWIAVRNVIIHGFGTVWINNSGEWLWQYAFLPNGKAGACQAGTIDADLASRMEAELASSTRSLCDRLENLTKKLS
jgi:hypothetical protein